MKKNILFLSLLFILGFLILPNLASAQPTTITQIVTNLATLITGIAIFVVVISWIITGLLFLTAQGDPAKITKARTALIWAVVGTAVAFLAGTAIFIIGNALSFGI